MKHSIRSALLTSLLSLSLGSGAILSALSQAQTAEQHHTVVPGDAVKWGPAPPSLPAGAQMAILTGDLSKKGPYVVRFKFPSGYKIPAHTHPNDENVTVISGTFHVGIGSKLDEKKGHMISAGGFVHLPKGMEHYAWASEETVIQSHSIGPAGITYVDPNDDPRLKKTTTQ